MFNYSSKKCQLRLFGMIWMPTEPVTVKRYQVTGRRPWSRPQLGNLQLTQKTLKTSWEELCQLYNENTFSTSTSRR